MRKLDDEVLKGFGCRAPVISEFLNAAFRSCG